VAVGESAGSSVYYSVKRSLPRGSDAGASSSGESAMPDSDTTTEGSSDQDWLIATPVESFAGFTSVTAGATAAGTGADDRGAQTQDVASAVTAAASGSAKALSSSAAFDTCGD
jgi:hypothetical protein